MKLLSTDFLTNCAHFNQNTDIFITLENTSVENKGLECTIAYNNMIENKFSNHVFISNMVNEIEKSDSSVNFTPLMCHHYAQNCI